MASANTETVCRAVLGDEYSPKAAEAYGDGDWTWEAPELPGLWSLYEGEYAKHDDVVNEPHLTAYRIGSEMRRNGKRLHELGDRARLLLTEEQAHAVMLSDAEVQKL